ncbi:hypothetical protein GCM10010247_66440 [Streptomyces calvus]|nr:hypothetical protein GCM10010247_66440 [Streptomyces calvus]
MFHALGGQRLPSLDTVPTVVSTCRCARAEPDFGVRDSDGSLTVMEAKSEAIDPETRDKWKALVGAGMAPSVTGACPVPTRRRQDLQLQLNDEEVLAAEVIAYSASSPCRSRSFQLVPTLPSSATRPGNRHRLPGLRALVSQRGSGLRCRRQ